MKRFLLILLMLLVPVQFAQAAVCSYCCQDEQPIAQPTSSWSLSAADLHTGNTETPPAQHACASCHMACSKLLLGVPLVPVTLTNDVVLHSAPMPLYHSPVALVPERPNWRTAA